MILSFTDWSFIAGIDKIKFNGVSNYVRLLQDQVFLKSFQNNLVLLLVVPVQLILALIWRRRKELLNDSNKTIEAVSRLLGYDNKGYFVKLFKQHYGIVPSRFV